MNYEQANSIKELALEVNGVLEKLGWKWQPEMGQWVLHRDTIYLVKDADIWIHTKNPIPILRWEIIEKILLCEIADGGCWNFYEPFTFEPEIYQGTFMRWEVKYMWRYPRTGVCPTKHNNWGKSRQEAVMKAVIELGKRKENKK